MSLTTTQHSAYGDLQRFGRLAPPAPGRKVARGTEYGYSRRTLAALVDAGLARWGDFLDSQVYPVETLAQDETDHAVQAAAYVTSRFYPPLPVDYGRLAVVAIRQVRNGHGDRPILLPADLRILPAQAVPYGDGYAVRPIDLVGCLRLEHLIYDADEEDE